MNVEGVTNVVMGADEAGEHDLADTVNHSVGRLYK